MARSGDVVEVFATFVRLRRAGHNREDTWNSIQSEVGCLTPAERERLVALMRHWEDTEGRGNGIELPVVPLVIHQEETHALRVETKPKRNSIRRIAPPPRAQSAQQQIECPACHHKNPDGEVYCYHCGTLLVQAGSTRRLVSVDSSEIEQPGDPAFFGDEMVLCVQVKGSDQVIQTRPRESEMVIGRRSPNNVMLPDIDLSDYQAAVMGVSRLHAGLRRHGNTVVLTDLGSVNHTRINGQRVHEHEVRVLHDGDEVQFGNLITRIYFKDKQGT
ncbi:MAG: FHA domain-containing protein [Anaerolineae bacterium]|nr:FHA domain-containing protein [Anaerolineae bacterium]